MTRMYILDGKTPIRAETPEQVEAMYQEPSRRVVRHDWVAGALISTVFLCIDHNLYSSDDPILFETMILGHEFDEVFQWRYRTWDEAEQGHDLAVAMFRKKMGLLS